MRKIFQKVDFQRDSTWQILLFTMIVFNRVKEGLEKKRRDETKRNMILFLTIMKGQKWKKKCGLNYNIDSD